MSEVKMMEQWVGTQAARSRMPRETNAEMLARAQRYIESLGVRVTDDEARAAVKRYLDKHRMGMRPARLDGFPRPQMKRYEFFAEWMDAGLDRTGVAARIWRARTFDREAWHAALMIALAGGRFVRAVRKTWATETPEVPVWSWVEWKDVADAIGTYPLGKVGGPKGEYVKLLTADCVAALIGVGYHVYRSRERGQKPSSQRTASACSIVGDVRHKHEGDVERIWREKCDALGRVPHFFDGWSVEVQYRLIREDLHALRSDVDHEKMLKFALDTLPFEARKAIREWEESLPE